MIALHPIWESEPFTSFNSKFLVRAEALSPDHIKTIKGKTRSSLPKEHAYQCVTGKLKRYLAATKLKTRKINVFLPTVGNIPFP